MDHLFWNISSIKSLARCWVSLIMISVTVRDNGVILEALPGVSLSPYGVLVGSYSALIMLVMKEEKVSILLLPLYCVTEFPGEVSCVQELCRRSACAAIAPLGVKCIVRRLPGMRCVFSPLSGGERHLKCR